jgi:hypothetical protein
MKLEHPKDTRVIELTSVDSISPRVENHFLDLSSSFYYSPSIKKENDSLIFGCTNQQVFIKEYSELQQLHQDYFVFGVVYGIGKIFTK